jgi:nucleoside-diphosphate-sugar epimerase
LTKIGILGGAGQIGWHLAWRLRENPAYDVVAVCRSALVAAPLELSGVSCAIYDRNSTRSLRHALAGVEVIVDTTFSSSARPGNDPGLRRFYDTTASLSTLRHLIHLSSIAVYGELSATSRAAFDRPRPDTVYGQQKLAAEKLIRRSFANSQAALSILRLGHVFGPYMAWSSHWLKLLRRGFPQARFLEKPSNAIHVAQVCESIQACLQTPRSGVWNGLADPNPTWREVLHWHDEALRLADPVAAQLRVRDVIPIPERYRARGRSLASEVYRSLKTNLARSVLGAPLTAQSIRRFLASTPFLPSVASVKAAVGAPLIHEYFASDPADEALFIFDSAVIPGANCSSTRPLDDADHRAFVDYLAAVQSSGLVRAHIRDSLANG